eukprot:scaffold6532_cov116-Isochrysis_galbana.AAC.17
MPPTPPHPTRQQPPPLSTRAVPTATGHPLPPRCPPISMVFAFFFSRLWAGVRPRTGPVAWLKSRSSLAAARPPPPVLSNLAGGTTVACPPAPKWRPDEKWD